MAQQVLFRVLSSPIGKLTLTGSKTAVTGLYFEDDPHVNPPPTSWTQREDLFQLPTKQLLEYFAGARTTFDFALSATGTPFQRKVWQELTHIPYGVTVSYGALADRIGLPGSARAVGGANGRNPISIVVPCHRVIGADGSLTGYGGGIVRKRWLLDFEMRMRPAHHEVPAWRESPRQAATEP